MEGRFTPRHTVFPARYETAPDVNVVFRTASRELRNGPQAGVAAACVIATSREIARRYFLR